MALFGAGFISGGFVVFVVLFVAALGTKREMEEQEERLDEDERQHYIRINGYVDIYKGALNLIEDVVQQVNNILDYLEVDTKIDGETPCIQLYTSEIIKSLFVPYAGGTSRCNMKKALDIKEDELKFEIKAEQHEW